MVAEHKGRIVQTTGDGLLIEFSSVVEACAVAVRRDMSGLRVPESGEEGEPQRTA